MCDTGFKQTQNHHKFLATGAEFVDHKLQANFAICTGITRLKDGRNITATSTMETNSQRAFGMSVVKSSHSCFPFISPFFTHMYTKPQITLKKTEEEEKLTQSLEIEFKVSFANWVADARKIQWKEEKVCACVSV